MKDLDTTWSHIVGRKLSNLRENRGLTLQELSERVGVSYVYIGSVLGRQKKGNEENFTKIGIALGMPEKKVKDMLIASMFEAIEQEYGAGFSFALKSQFGLSESAIRDVMKFIKDIQKKEQENS